MKDEEMADKYAEEYFGKKTELVEVWKVKSCKENFLAGLKAGKAEAKDLIRNLLRVTYGEGWNYSLDWKVKAEQFLKE